jgi:hypothetical protein
VGAELVATAVVPRATTAGLSLGDRACLAVAQGIPDSVAIIAAHAWLGLAQGSLCNSSIEQRKHPADQSDQPGDIAAMIERTAPCGSMIEAIRP